MFSILVDDDAVPQNPSSPLLQSKAKKTQLVSFFRSHSAGNPSPGHLRRRNLQHIPESLPGRQPDTSLFDTTSLYSSPSMLSLHLNDLEEENAQATPPHILTEKIEVVAYMITYMMKV